MASEKLVGKNVSDTTLKGVITIDSNNDWVGINSSTRIEDTALQIGGQKAFLLPRMNTTQRDALTGRNGMLIYNATLNKFQGYENGAWVSLV